MADLEDGIRRPVRATEVVLVLLGFLLVTWIYWKPLFLDPGKTWSVGRDYFQNNWNLWWTRFAWGSGRNLFHCDHLFYPAGTSLAFHTISFSNTIPGLFLQDFLPLAKTHTFLFLGNFYLSALAAWGLARQVTGSAWGAFLAGLFYSFNPYHTAMVTQLNNATFQWMPLFFLAWVLLLRTGRWWYVAWTGIFLALAGYADWYQPVQCALGGGVFLLLLLFREGRWLDWKLGTKILLAGTFAFLLALPGLAPLIPILKASGAELTVPARFVGSMQLLGMRPQGSPFFHFWPAVLGWSSTALLVYGLFRARDRTARGWWALLLFAFLLVQGPYLVVLNRHFESIPLPMALFPHLPVLNLLRVPHRFLILVVLAMGVLMAFALRRLLDSRRMAPLGGLLVCGLVALELQPPQREPVTLDYADIYDDLAADPAHYAILELPLDFRDGYSMWLQTRHHKSLVGGYTSHILPEALGPFRTPLMRALLPAVFDQDMPELPRFEKVDVANLSEGTLADWRRELMTDKKVRVILFHGGPDFPPPERKIPASPGFGEKLAISLLPFRFNPLLADVESWRRRAVAEGMEKLAKGSGQARQIVERLFGPPDYVQGRTEVWDLRRPRAGAASPQAPRIHRPDRK